MTDGEQCSLGKSERAWKLGAAQRVRSQHSSAVCSVMYRLEPDTNVQVFATSSA